MSNTPPPPPPPGSPDDPGAIPPVPPPGGSTAPVPPVPPPPGGYSQPGPPAAPQPGAPAPQFGAPQYGAPAPQYGAPAPQFGAPQYGAPPGGYQPPAEPYQYGTGLPSSAALASPGKRIGGYLIDLVILLVVIGICWIPAILAISSSETTYDQYGYANDDISGGAIVALIIAFAVTVIVPIAYHIAFVATKGQTPGAMAVKVKIVRLSDGQTPGWGPATMRWLPNLVGMIPYLGSCLSLGLVIWALVNLFSNERRQTPYDLAAKTVVIDVA